MTIGKRIRIIRNLRGMTQKQLGIAVGFSETTADVRIAQYESGARTPKEKCIHRMAEALSVRAEALWAPDINTFDGIMSTLFAIEDKCGLQPVEVDGDVYLRFTNKPNIPDSALSKMVIDWHNQLSRLNSGEITKEQYDLYRYNYQTKEL